jgi:hypothetical protein
MSTPAAAYFRSQNLLATPIDTPQDSQKRMDMLQVLLDDFHKAAQPIVEKLIKELPLNYSTARFNSASRLLFREAACL